jgi:cytidylate kinase
MPVIALTQGMGSLAQDVAEQLAKELGLSTLQHEIAARVADRMHVPKSLISRLRTGKAGALERWRADTDSIAVYTAEQVLEAAARGNVVLRGWGATQLLRPVPHVPCIRIMRPFEQRVQWLMTELDTDDRSMAEHEIKRSDEANASRMHEQFGVAWGDPVLFDLVINMDRISVDSAVAQIRSLLARPEFTETEASRSLLQGLALSAHVRAALRADERTREIIIGIDSAGGVVKLTGIVVNDTERALVEEVGTAVPGVVSVDNQLHVMKTPKLFTSSKQT